MQFDPVTTDHPVYWLKQHLMNRSCSVLKGYARYKPTLFTNLSIVNWWYIALFISSPIQMFGQSPVSCPQYTKMKSSRSQYWRGRVSEDLCRDRVATRSVQGCPLAYNTDPCASYNTALYCTNFIMNIISIHNSIMWIKEQCYFFSIGIFLKTKLFRH